MERCKPSSSDLLVPTLVLRLFIIFNVVCFTCSFHIAIFFVASCQLATRSMIGGLRTLVLRCPDNRRPYCLKQFQQEAQEDVEVLVCVIELNKFIETLVFPDGPVPGKPKLWRGLAWRPVTKKWMAQRSPAPAIKCARQMQARGRCFPERHAGHFLLRRASHHNFHRIHSSLVYCICDKKFMWCRSCLVQSAIGSLCR